jgi:hypothetical protein
VSMVTKEFANVNATMRSEMLMNQSHSRGTIANCLKRSVSHFRSRFWVFSNLR